MNLKTEGINKVLSSFWNLHMSKCKNVTSMRE